MKTKNEIRLQVENYLQKTSKHLFRLPKIGMKFQKGIVYSYDYSVENSKIFSIIKIDNKWFTDIDGLKTELNIDYYLGKYLNNSKCIIKNELFQNKKAISISKKIKNKRVVS